MILKGINTEKRKTHATIKMQETINLLMSRQANKE
jgi:hypothetical protein